MPSTFARVFTSINRNGYTPVNSHLPLLNEFSSSLSGYVSSQNQLSKKKALMRWYKSIPELTAFVNKISRDIVSRYHFETVNPSDSGRNRLLKANRFAAEVQLRKVMESQVADALITGEAFGWIGKLSETQIEDVAEKMSRLYTGFERKEKDIIIRDIVNEISSKKYSQYESKQEFGIGNLKDIDEDILKPRKYRYLPSTTMEIVYDEHDILDFRHCVGAYNPVVFNTDEIVHYTFMDRDGKVNGFTPVESVVLQLELLRCMWQNLASIHKNGGSPDKIFSIEDINPNSPAYQRIKEQLEKYKLVENKHGNLLFTGKLTVTDLQAIDQMQFKDSGLYITGLIAMQWGVPRSSIPYIISGTNTKDDTGGNSEKGYWEAVAYMQEAFAETMNVQLWMPYFGVRICLENAYINLDVQRETALQMKLNNVMAIDTILAKDGMMLSEEKRLRLLDLTEEDVEEMEIEDPLEMETEDSEDPSGSTLDKQPSKDSLKPQGQQNMAQSRRTQQNNVIASRGRTPSGVGKSADSNEFDKFRKYPYVS
jgi:hypothetical protein